MGRFMVCQPNLQEQCLRLSAFAISRGCMPGRRRSIIARDFQSCLAKTVDQVLDEFGIPPLPEFVARNDAEIRSYRQELPDRIARCIAFAELRVRCGKREVRSPKGGHVDFEDNVQRALVVVLAVSIEEQGEPIPSGMIRIEPRSPFRQSATSLPVAGVRNLEAQIGGSESIHGVEGEGAFRRCAESPEFMPEEQGRR